MTKYILAEPKTKLPVVEVSLVLDEQEDICICYNGIKVAWITQSNGMISSYGLEEEDQAALEALGVEFSDRGYVLFERNY